MSAESPDSVADDVTRWWSLARRLGTLRRAGSSQLTAWRDTRRLLAETEWCVEAADLNALYEPLLAVSPDGRFTIGHLGQSLDGQIATASGHSEQVTGHDNLVHLHRLRALSDAIVVGAGTIAADDPQLTTRLVNGPHPVRVVIDPSGSVARRNGVFNDGVAPTLTVVAEEVRLDDVDESRLLRLPRVDGELSPAAIQNALYDSGLSVLYVEGGGVTVSRWLLADRLDRLHVATSAVLIGTGRSALQLPTVATMNQARRHACHLFRMGRDILWDIDPRAPAASSEAGAGAGPAAVQRLL